eukprot:TRINITY_DN1088_c0_g1_i4.p1 TRINITY_DN1088_c0_g1~~TRINITY_DN1088_c0_g1_i4.p1  ORF type:complete len:387 (+),score=95.50 TRINITY_DN1088_c0_g1_i4:139-1299(+)
MCIRDRYQRRVRDPRHMAAGRSAQIGVVGVRVSPFRRYESGERTTTTDLMGGCPFELPPELLFDESEGSAGAEGQRRVYDRLAAPVVHGVLKGTPGTVLAYGQTGSGKTHTLSGSEKGAPGMLTLAMQHIVGASPERLSLAAIELYNEQVKDLLQPGPALKIGSVISDTGERVWGVEGLHEVEVHTLEEALQVLVLAERHRFTACTNMGASSSRSHVLTMINVQCTGQQSTQLVIADLAGSERVAKSGCCGDRLREAQTINRSLMCLQDCALAYGESAKHIPIRNSKLGMLLQRSLTGAGRTAAIITVAPGENRAQETLNTLRAARALNMLRQWHVWEWSEAEHGCWSPSFRRGVCAVLLSLGNEVPVGILDCIVYEVGQHVQGIA